MQPINRAVPGAVAELLRGVPLSPGKVAFAWTTAVGPALNRVSAVRLEGTRLIVDAASAQWAREIARATPVILTRLRTFLGTQAVTSIEVRGRA
jgi:hypothetical protein